MIVIFFVWHFEPSFDGRERAMLINFIFCRALYMKVHLVPALKRCTRPPVCMYSALIPADSGENRYVNVMIIILNLFQPSVYFYRIN